MNAEVQSKREFHFNEQEREPEVDARDADPALWNSPFVIGPVMTGAPSNPWPEDIDPADEPCDGELKIVDRVITGKGVGRHIQGFDANGEEMPYLTSVNVSTMVGAQIVFDGDCAVIEDGVLVTKDVQVHSLRWHGLAFGVVQAIVNANPWLSSVWWVGDSRAKAEEPADPGADDADLASLAMGLRRGAMWTNAGSTADLVLGVGAVDITVSVPGHGAPACRWCVSVSTIDGPSVGLVSEEDVDEFAAACSAMVWLRRLASGFTARYVEWDRCRDCLTTVKRVAFGDAFIALRVWADGDDESGYEHTWGVSFESHPGLSMDARLQAPTYRGRAAAEAAADEWLDALADNIRAHAIAVPHTMATTLVAAQAAGND